MSGDLIWDCSLSNLTRSQYLVERPLFSFRPSWHQTRPCRKSIPLGRAHPPFFIADSNEHECIIILTGLRSHKHSGRTVSVSNKCRVCHFSSCFAQNLSCSKKALPLVRPYLIAQFHHLRDRFHPQGAANYCLRITLRTPVSAQGFSDCAQTVREGLDALPRSGFIIRSLRRVSRKREFFNG